MNLKAITYNYTEDGILCNRVIGIFTRKQLVNAINNIRNNFGKGKSIKSDIYDADCDNYFLEYLDEENSHFYSSDYVVGELWNCPIDNTKIDIEDEIETALLEAIWIMRWNKDKTSMSAVLTEDEAASMCKNIIEELCKAGYKIEKI